MVEKLEGVATVAAEGVDITAATTLWPLLGLSGVGVLEVVVTADTTARTLVRPLMI